MTTITLRPEHGYVFLVAGALAFTMMALGGVVGYARAKVFTKEFKASAPMAKLAEEHKKAFPSQKFCPDVRHAAARTQRDTAARSHAAAARRATQTWAAASSRSS